MAEMKTVKGIGELPNHFIALFKKYNIELGDKSGNYHNEGRVVGMCNEADPFFDDEFYVSGYATRSGYHLEIKLNSEVGVPLFANGVLKFDYDTASGKWDAHAYRANEKLHEWRLCNPKAVFDFVIAGLQCVGKEFHKPEIASATTLLAASLGRYVYEHPSEKELVATYDAADCQSKSAKTEEYNKWGDFPGYAD